jgi:hypothetical protein
MNNTLKLVATCFPFLLAACSTTSVNTDNVEISGTKFSRNDNGEVVLTANEVELLKNKQDVVIVERVLPDGGVAITPEELKLLSHDSQLFGETINNKEIDDKIFTFLVKKGSLKSNLKRLTRKYSTEKNPIKLEFAGVDYYISESRIIRADSISAIAGELLSDFPVFTSIEDEA